MSSSTRGRGSRFAQRRATEFISQSALPVTPHTSSTHPEDSEDANIEDSFGRVDIGGSSTGDGDGDGDGTPSGGNTDARIELILVSKNLYPVGVNPIKVSQLITTSFRKYVDREGTAWKHVSDEFRDTYWEEFKKNFRWAPPLTDAIVYPLWLKRAATRYRDHMAKMKTDKPIKGRPPYVPVETWSHFCEYWDTDEVKKKSEIAKRNRLSEPDGPGTGFGRHRGGSKSAVAYSYEMAREKNIPVGETIIPTFKKLHFSQSEQTYTSGKAKRIAEEVEAQVADLNQHLPEGVDPSVEDTTSIFIRVAQDPAKHRVFGLGSLYDAPPPVELSTATQPSVSSSTQIHPALVEMQAKMKEDREAMDARLAAEQAAREATDARLADEKAARLELLGEFSAFKEVYQQQQLLLQRLIAERDTPP